MKILIISTYFPPQNAIASLRPYSWAKYWSAESHHVTVITTKKRNCDNNLEIVNNGFEVISIPVPFLDNAAQKMNHIVKQHAVYLKKASFLIKLKNKYHMFCQKTGCNATCRYPDFHDLWAKKAFDKVKNNYYDMIISTGGPYSVHRVGLSMKRKYPNTKWIVDWRDLWTKNHMFAGLVIFYPIEKYLEKKIHRTANLITTVSEPFAKILAKMTQTPVKVIYNGFDPDDFICIKNTPRKNNSAFTIVYTGTIYPGFRDPSPLFEAIANLKKENVISSENLQVFFAGINTNVKEIAERYGITDFCTFCGMLPRNIALQMQYDADVVLFLEYASPKIYGVLTGKLFEYLYIAREILAIGIDKTFSAGELINDTHAGISLGNDVKKIEYYLYSRVIKHTMPTLEKKYDLIDYFTRKKQSGKIIDYVMGLSE